MYYKLTPELFDKDYSTFRHYSLVNGFVHSVSCRLPFEVTFLSPYVVSITFCYGGHTHKVKLDVFEFEKVMSYALMHIDDTV